MFDLMIDPLGAQPFFDGVDFVKLLFRLTLNLTVAAVLIGAIYFRLHRNKEYAFTYLLFNLITFSLCYLLRKVPIELGFALGLFAVFGILRYRTEPIRIRDLTYLFIVIGLAIVNALANKRISLMEVLLVNGVVVGATALVEYAPWNGRERSGPLRYDNLELLKPDSREALLQDLRSRTGLHVVRVDLGRIDLLRDSADLTIYYHHHQE